MRRLLEAAAPPPPETVATRWPGVGRRSFYAAIHEASISSRITLIVLAAVLAAYTRNLWPRRHPINPPVKIVSAAATLREEHKDQITRGSGGGGGGAV